MFRSSVPGVAVGSERTIAYRMWSPWLFGVQTTLSSIVWPPSTSNSMGAGDVQPGAAPRRPDEPRGQGRAEGPQGDRVVADPQRGGLVRGLRVVHQAVPVRVHQGLEEAHGEVPHPDLAGVVHDHA